MKPGTGSSRYCRHYAYLVPGLGSGLQALEEPDVLTVDVYIYEMAQVPRLITQALLDSGILRLQGINDLDQGISLASAIRSDAW